mmetsp:Transcript_19607/g.42244  ORF Transcript_19607/g.42244 Transcript_19607/m.42244 type:complete len:289 (+) Transcript_19607:1500-2366(+)
MNITALSSKAFILLNAKEQIQVALWSSVRTSTTLSADQDPTAVFHTSGNVDFNSFRRLFGSTSFTIGTVVQLYFTFTMAIVTSLFLSLPNGRVVICSTARSVANGTSDDRMALSTATARLACLQLINLNGMLSTRNGGLKVNLQIHLHIGSNGRPPAKATGVASLDVCLVCDPTSWRMVIVVVALVFCSTANLASTEKGRVNVFNVGTKPLPPGKRVVRGGCFRQRFTASIHIVISTHLWVAQCFIGSIDFLKEGSRILTRVNIGVVLFREFAVSALDFLVGGLTRNP